MTTLPKMNFAQAMNIWQAERVLDITDEHLTPKEIRQAAEINGLANLDEATMEHLALCPTCLEVWAAECKKIETKTDDRTSYDVADDWYSGGTLEAAATAEKSSQMNLTSTCGNFLLNIFQKEDGSGMVALEVRNSFAEEHSEGRNAIVQDSNGLILMEGKIIGRRMARIIENIDSYNLHTWSIIIKQE